VDPDESNENAKGENANEGVPADPDADADPERADPPPPPPARDVQKKPPPRLPPAPRPERSPPDEKTPPPAAAVPDRVPPLATLCGVGGSIAAGAFGRRRAPSASRAVAASAAAALASAAAAAASAAAALASASAAFARANAVRCSCASRRASSAFKAASFAAFAVVVAAAMRQPTTRPRSNPAEDARRPFRERRAFAAAPDPDAPLPKEALAMPLSTSASHPAQSRAARGGDVVRVGAVSPSAGEEGSEEEGAGRVGARRGKLGRHLLPRFEGAAAARDASCAAVPFAAAIETEPETEESP